MHIHHKPLPLAAWEGLLKSLTPCQNITGCKALILIKRKRFTFVELNIEN